MKVSKITAEFIEFDNGNKITYSSEVDCGFNYADFEYLVEEQNGEIYNVNFPTELKFEICEEFGFRFGFGDTMFSVPCYSIQNGYYSDEVTIYYFENGEKKEVISNLKATGVSENCFYYRDGDKDHVYTDEYDNDGEKLLEDEIKRNKRHAKIIEELGAHPYFMTLKE